MAARFVAQRSGGSCLLAAAYRRRRRGVARQQTRMAWRRHVLWQRIGLARSSAAPASRCGSIFAHRILLLRLQRLTQCLCVAHRSAWRSSLPLYRRRLFFQARQYRRYAQSAARNGGNGGVSWRKSAMSRGIALVLARNRRNV